MLLRKKRSSSQPARAPSAPTPSAVTAAAQVFLKQQVEDAKLSNAAAAAALRSHTTSPIPVGDIQTKRMVRRGSTSSYSGGTTANRPPFGALQRSPSSGSMSERTFRSQSPAGSRSASPVRHDNVPPVPKIPTAVASVANSSEKRFNSTQSTLNTPHTSSNTGILKPLNTATAANEARARAARPSSALANPSSPQADSPRSINFSRPMSPQMNGSASHQRNGSNALPARGAVRPASSLGFAQQSRGQNSRQVSQSSISNAAVTAALSAASPAAGRAQNNLGSRPSSSLSTTRSKSPTNGPPGMVWVPMDEAIRRGLVPSAKSSQPQRPASALATTRATSPPAVRNAPPVPSILSSVQASANQNVAPRPRPASALSNNQNPSDEQIRVFQTRAAALLARPRSDAAAAAESSKSSLKPQPTPARAKNSAQSSVQTHSRSVSQPTSQLAPPGARVGRSTSISPSRSAHFSSSPIISAVKHEPLPRAASPFKSALKSHSSRPTSPAPLHATTQSDTSSLRSEDGSVASTKRKKQVRVSFDATPLTVGEATTPVSPINSIASPQNAQLPPLENLGANDEQGMGSRPALPTFGSVRSRKASSEAESQIAKDVTAPSIAVQPATPAIEEAAKFERPVTPPQAHHVRGPSLEDALSAENVQHVSQSSPKQLKFDSIPESTPHTVTETQSAVVVETPSHIVAEPVATAQANSSPSTVTPNSTIAVQDTLAALRHSEEASDEDEAPEQFTDAAEGQSDDDQPANYASLDAILEDAPEGKQPMVPPPITEEPAAPSKAPQAVSSAPSMLPPGAALTTLDPSVPASEQNWETVRAYWSSLSTSQRQQLEAEAMPLPEEDSLLEPPAQVTPTKTRSKPAEANDNLPPWPDKMYRSSMTSRQEAAASSNVRQPKANSEPVLARGTLRGASATASAEPKKERTPVNAMSKTMREKSQSTPRPASNVSAEAAALARSIDPKSVLKKPLLSRKGSDDSIGSDSSFKRGKRRGSANDSASQYTMKRSMRGAPSRAVTKAEKNDDSRSRRTTMRHSVRNSIDSTVSTDKGRESKLSFLGASKLKGSKSSTKKSGVSSRFADSSDEDDDGPPRIGGFSSRFEDSDDEDGLGALDLSPVRRPPRAAGRNDGDSTDLSDDSDADAGVAASKRRQSATNGKVFGSALGSGTLRNNEQVSEKAKSSTFPFSRKKKSEGPSSPASAMSERPESRLSRSMRDGGGSKRSSSKSSFLRRLSFSQPNSPRREEGRNEFPFEAPPIPDIPDQFRSKPDAASTRPFTADGVPNGGNLSRPALGGKRVSTMTTPDADNGSQVIVSSRTGKKKRFQSLRRVLRMD